MKIDSSHPRALSLQIREKLVTGVKKGITSQGGLIAHGRGEAFDYLIGEKTQEFALPAIEAAATLLIQARNPVLSINGNTAALVLDECIKLAKISQSKIEVNLFHYSKMRVKIIEQEIRKKAPDVLLASNKQKIIFYSIVSPRKTMLKRGIGEADVIFVPLEDGDRAEALIARGQKVITVDLNPLSRTAQYATITIVDNIIRTIPLLIAAIVRLKKEKHTTSKFLLQSYNNKKILAYAISYISHRLTTLADTLSNMV